MKKKVAYITRHTVSNYGSVLQAYATQTALENLGYDPVCINYWREDEKPKNLAATLLQTSRWNKNALTRALYQITQKPVFDYAVKKFDGYRGALLSMTEKEYNTVSQLEKDLPDADVYMTGSDQVWNTITKDEIDPAFFLSFVPSGRRKIAYAASFGGKTVKETDRKQIQEYLKRYDAVSIREASGVKLAEELGVSAVQVLDPTFLIEKEDWEKIIPQKKPPQQYVLVYQLHPNKAFEKYAKAFAEKKGLPLYRVHPYFHHFVKCGKFICCPPVSEFLWYIKNAEYFLTDSFHGTSFAINLNTNFIDILPNKYSERNLSILQLTGLTRRILQNDSDFSAADTPIDFQKVNTMIQAERKKSLQILKAMIEGNT